MKRPVSLSRRATLALQQQGLIAAYVQAGAALLVGLAQCGLIAWGIRKMDASNQRRERQEAQAEARYTESARQAEARHAESARQAEARHAETMLALQQQGEYLKQQGEALRTLIERTAPKK